MINNLTNASILHYFISCYKNGMGCSFSIRNFPYIILKNRMSEIPFLYIFIIFTQNTICQCFLRNNLFHFFYGINPVQSISGSFCCRNYFIFYPGNLIIISVCKTIIVIHFNNHSSHQLIYSHCLFAEPCTKIKSPVQLLFHIF